MRVYRRYFEEDSFPAAVALHETIDKMPHTKTNIFYIMERRSVDIDNTERTMQIVFLCPTAVKETERSREAVV